MTAEPRGERTWIADSHFHIWDLQHGRYPWLDREDNGQSFLGDYSSLRRTFLLDEYLAAARDQDVRTAVHLEANPADPVAETAWLQNVCDISGFPIAIVGFARLQDRRVSQVIDSHRQYSRFRGIRQALNWGNDGPDGKALMGDSAWRSGFSLLGPLGLSFDMQIFPSQMITASKLAADFPDTLIVLNHTGVPLDTSRSGRQTWKRGMGALARHDNVVVKISGFAQMNPLWSITGIRPFVLETIQAFGPSRCMFASNYPVDHRYGTFDAIFDAYRSITADCSPCELNDLYHETAIRTYRLNELPEIAAFAATARGLRARRHIRPEETQRAMTDQRLLSEEPCLARLDKLLAQHENPVRNDLP